MAEGTRILAPPALPASEHGAQALEETFVLKQGTPVASTADDRTSELWAFFRGEIVPLRDARISVMTHAFNYGTAVFEGIRAYWNAEQGQLWALDLIQHYERLKASARLLMMDVPYTAEELASRTVGKRREARRLEQLRDFCLTLAR